MAKPIINESKEAQKDLAKAPKEIQISFEAWARLLEEHGHSILRKFKGYHDEKLVGPLKALRSSRLNKQWRVIYSLDKNGKVQIIEVKRTPPHDYRRKK